VTGKNLVRCFSRPMSRLGRPALQRRLNESKKASFASNVGNVPPLGDSRLRTALPHAGAEIITKHGCRKLGRSGRRATPSALPIEAPDHGCPRDPGAPVSGQEHVRVLFSAQEFRAFRECWTAAAQALDEKGGTARPGRMTRERRAAIAKKAAQKRWNRS
jgi:hypothetical protein